MNIKNLFFMLFACAILVGCQSDDDLGADSGVGTFAGDKAYVAIKVMNIGGMRGAADGYENGSETENNVSVLDFYFYNADGTFNQHIVLEDYVPTAQTGNVEEVGEAQVVLRDLKQKGTPKYVVAILNGKQPSSGYDPEYAYLSLTQLQAQIKQSYLEGSDFIITNSTYDNADATSKYFATEIPVGSFQLQPIQGIPQNPVEIYVERLAAKVSLGVKDGVVNADNKISIGKYMVDGVEKDLYITINGWGLNATAKESFVMKNVPAWNYFDVANQGGNSEFADKIWGRAWAAPSNELTAGDYMHTTYRSHWAISTKYNAANPENLYPTSYSVDIEAGKKYDEITDKALNYFAWSSMTLQPGNYAYCMENTAHRATLLKNNNFKAVTTHVILAATLDGSADLVRFYGKLYTKDAFLNNVLSQLLVKYRKEDGSTYKGIEISDVEVVPVGDGKVYVQLTNAAKGKDWVDDANVVVDATVIDAALKSIFVGTSKEYAEYYNGGKMYYCIPVEHIRGGKIKYNDDANGTYTVEEGDYGIVRNHSYNLQVTKIENLGTAVYNPDEIIVPNPEIPTYYVGAKINILAWQIVNQNVEL